MLSFLKVFLRGIVTTVLLPVILLIWVGYGVYCIFIFIFMFFKGVIDYFRGKSFNADLPEDLESRRMLLEKEKRDEQTKDMMNLMYQNVFGQGRVITPEGAQQSYEETNPYTQPEENSSLEETIEEPQQNEESEDDLRGN